ncbi:MAG: ABC transporter permease, partial [Chitinophagaceae bacterium]
MIKNYLKVAWRNLMKNKIFSLINILGLTLGFTSCFLISLYIQHEISYDKYHQNSKRIYRLATHIQGSTYGEGIAKIAAPWAPAAKQEIPEIEEFTRFMRYGQALIKQGAEQIYDEEGFFADSTVFKVFSWKFNNGNASTALNEPNSVVLTESFAHKLFKEVNPVGKTLNIDNEPVFKVTGVIQDPPPNSHFDFSFLVSLSTYKNDDLHSWTNYQFYTYLLLKPGASSEAVAKKLGNLLTTNLKEEAKAHTPFLQLLTDIHLHSNLFREITPNSDVTTIYIVGIIALIILFIACMNFVNLTTAKAANRAKEVGIRKASGAKKSNL